MKRMLFHIGTYTQKTSKGIYGVYFDTESGNFPNQSCLRDSFSHLW